MRAFGAGKWQTEFMSKIQSQRVRIDGIAVHWYDWGNQTNNAATDSLTAERVFNRFKTYIQNVRTAYPNLPIWITEFNANMNRKSQVVQMYFMKLSTEWLNTLDYVERYSFFFEPDYPSANPDGTMSAIGAYWKSLPTTKAYTGGNHIADATLIK
ncbi:glycosyl hydrolase [Phnomibacter ginsenosidimutans]|uniref:glycosyl hydrolase n=1 Tax=Phnomibacter ginsenosidimutans TaxID=2676868 RepID=UPI003CCD9D32